MINRRTQYETNIYYHKILQQKYKITNFSKNMKMHTQNINHRKHDHKI